MIITKLAEKLDIPGVLALQDRYLYAHLSEAEREFGFVTTPFTLVQIEEIMLENGLFVAIFEGKVIAYVFSGSWKYFSAWPIFPFMEARLEYLKFGEKKITSENSFQYGPVCIDQNFRGGNLLNQIFEEMRLVFSEKYPICITFINQVNKVSFRAHTQKLGWAVVDEFEFNARNYYGLALDMHKTVLQNNK